ncbi:hypothetical protein DNH61_07410 [Paenibacillus sambharensis]|uniref:Uncharacterized protein n=1 Tax=Paenibacillus sambharensis TaxID=1803190 RepID=A0A2W1LCK1_9BACL|nr:hypothetical protein [Paenibacillus sambharensis]PZD96613.1 hypothetical protein DNH61_07410 [Paenibacillus sambharensis]
MNSDFRLESRLKQIDIPEIDVEERVMISIKQRSLQGKHRKMFKPVVLASLIVLLIACTGYATAELLTLYDEKGRVTLQFHQETDSGDILSRDEKQYYLGKVEAGKAIAVYKTEGNPEEITTTLVRPLIIEQLSELSGITVSEFIQPLVISEPLTFKSAKVTYMPANLTKQEIDTLKRQAAGHIASQKIEVTDQIAAIDIELLYKGDAYWISIREGKGWEEIYTNLKGRNSQTIKVDQSDGLVLDSSDELELYWRRDSEEASALYVVKGQGNGDHEAEALTAVLEAFISPSGG